MVFRSARYRPLAVMLALFLTACTESSHNVDAGAEHRIVSLAPSITETLFALGLGDRVVGVTRYCDYPPEAKQIEQVGGYYDPSYEAIVRLRPDLVVTVEEHTDAREHLAEFGIDVVGVNQKTVPGILTTIRTLGARCGVAQRGDSIASAVERRIRQIAEATSSRPRPRVLLTIGRNMGSSTLEDVYIAGGDGFYSDLIEMAGGQNAYTDDVRFPVVSGEGIIRLNPDVILDLVADLEERGWDEQVVLRQWQSVPSVSAVRNGRVHVLTGDYVVIPGPRFPLLLEDMVRAIHPDFALPEAGR